MWCGTDVSRDGVFYPFAGGCCCLRSLRWDWAAVLPRELPGPYSGTDLDTPPSPQMRSWSKYVSQSKVMVPRGGFILLHRSGSTRETLAGTEPKGFATLGTQRSVLCHLLSVVVLSASSSATSSLLQACATCRPRSKLPSLIPAFRADIWDFCTGWVQQREQ